MLTLKAVRRLVEELINADLQAWKVVFKLTTGI